MCNFLLSSVPLCKTQALMPFSIPEEKKLSAGEGWINWIARASTRSLDILQHMAKKQIEH
jgi:hypothetical protein